MLCILSSLLELPLFLLYLQCKPHVFTTLFKKTYVTFLLLFFFRVNQCSELLKTIGFKYVFYNTLKHNYLFKINKTIIKHYLKPRHHCFKKLKNLKKKPFFLQPWCSKTGSQGANIIFVICKRCVSGNLVVCGMRENYVLIFLIIITIVNVALL